VSRADRLVADPMGVRAGGSPVLGLVALADVVPDILPGICRTAGENRGTRQRAGWLDHTVASLSVSTRSIQWNERTMTKGGNGKGWTRRKELPAESGRVVAFGGQRARRRSASPGVGSIATLEGERGEAAGEAGTGHSQDRARGGRGQVPVDLRRPANQRGE